MTFQYKAFIWGRLNANLAFGALWGSPAFYSWISNFKLYTIRFVPNTFFAKIIHPLNFLQALVIWSYTFCNCSLGINCCCWEIRNVIRKLDITNNNCHFKTGAFRRPQINALFSRSVVTTKCMSPCWTNIKILDIRWPVHSHAAGHFVSSSPLYAR